MSDRATLDACLESAGELERQGQFDAALSQYERADGFGDRSWSTRARHLRLLYQLGRIHEARRLANDYVQSVHQVPGGALNDLGVINSEQGQVLEAMKRFIEAPRSRSPAGSSV